MNVPAPAGRHEARTELERSLCAELTSQGVSHEHRSLHFRVTDATGSATRYDPPLVVRRGSIVFLLEPIPEAAADRIGIMSKFLEQHSPELVLVVVAPAALFPRIPPDAYDERYDAADLAQVVRRIRDQDPAAIVEPFPKDRLP
jgi:hypothetical protein